MSTTKSDEKAAKIERFNPKQVKETFCSSNLNYVNKNPSFWLPFDTKSCPEIISN